MKTGKLPSVPEYYQKYIDPNCDLIQTPKQCCPFHKENTPSFSYDIRTGRWSCFGKCHTHGDVIDMHQRWFHLSTRQEAEKDLCEKYGVDVKKPETLKTEQTIVSSEKVEDNVVFNRALLLANTPERWAQLDYAMSKYPYNRLDIEELIFNWSGGSRI